MVTRKKKLQGQRVLLFIIQSLRPNERQTGSLLHEDISPRRHLVEKCDFLLRNVSTESELTAVFSEIRKCARNGAIVFIHIEAHGSEDGLLLSSGTMVDWVVINDELRRINVIKHNYLIVLLAMCYGGWIISRTDPFDRAPFRAIISNMGSIDERRLQNAFSAFYDTYFFSMDHEKALIAMNKQLAPGDHHFDFFKSEYFFDNFRVDLDPANFQESVDHNARDLFNRRRAFRRTSFEQFRLEFEKAIVNEYAALKRNRDYFIMTDLRTGKKLKHPPLKLGSTITTDPY